MRKTDPQDKHFFRASERLFCMNGEWYFQTREQDHGPFTRREAAEAAMSQYATEMDDLMPFSQSRLAESKESTDEQVQRSVQKGGEPD